MAGPRSEFLIGPADPSSDILARAEARLRADPEASVLTQGKGHLVASMSDEAAERLTAEFGTQLLIESNSPLKF